jgi:hypothetical protein
MIKKKEIFAIAISLEDLCIKISNIISKGCIY